MAPPRGTITASQGAHNLALEDCNRTRTPSLAGFERILDILALELKDAADPQREVWIRNSLTAAGTKLRALEFILGHFPGGTAPSMLDIGAQIGSLATYAASLGIQSAAVDLHYFADKFSAAARKHGVDYRICDVLADPLPFADGTFDAVTYLDVLEHHAASPSRTLREVLRVLKSKGFVIFATPNQASIYNRIRLLFGGSISDPFDYFFSETAELNPYPGHHREYVRFELRRALANSGFRVIECRVIDEDFRPQLALVRQERIGNLAEKLWRHKKELVPAALGGVWSALRLPFGRVLWAVGVKE